MKKHTIPRILLSGNFVLYNTELRTALLVTGKVGLGTGWFLSQ